MANADGPQRLHVRVFLSSPGDLAEERDLARRLLKDELPVDPFLRDRVGFDVVSWDDPAAPTPLPAGLAPQEAVIRFGPKPSQCDIVLVILWSRLGTHLDVGTFRKPGGEPYLSGTEWEFEDAWNATPRPEILVYRRTEVPTAKLSDTEADLQEKRRQYEGVGQFVGRLRNADGSFRGSWADYETPAQLGKRLASDLRHLLRRRLEPERVAAGKGVPVAPLPHVFGGAMPPENRLFTGREDLLRALHTALSARGGAAALTQAAVHGLGGVGKTSTARAYVQRHGGDHAGVWWIAAEERTGILAGLGGLARALDPGLPAETTLEEAAQAALRRIERAGEPLLLVYDNLPSPEALEGLVPARGARVLITSRWQDWGGWTEELPVAVMAEDEAAAFLQKRSGRRDEPGARRLARALGCLPLALDHAGAYVRRSLTGFDDYVRRAEALLGTAPRGAEYPASVAATFALAIEAAAKQSPAAETLLGLFAWLAPERIPLLLVSEEAMPPPERAAGLEALGGVSLIAPAPAAEGGPAASVHRLVQAVMRARLAARGETEETRAVALDLLGAAFPDDAYHDPSQWPLCRLLMPHVEALLSWLGTEYASEALAFLLSKVDSFLDGQGASQEAEAYSRRALEVYERVLGPEHLSTLASQSNLAACLRAKGDPAAAEPLYRRALEARERVLGPEHPDTLNSLNDLAACFQDKGDAAAAEPLHRRALEGYERVLGREHPSTLLTLNTLAACLRAKGDLAAAEALHRRALEARERVLGPEHPHTLNSLNNLATCLRAKGDADAAEALHRRALEARERVLGPEHPHTLNSLNDLAGCLRAKGDPAGAEPLYRRALEARERVLGREHPSTLRNLNDLAACLQDKGDADAAEPLYRRALEARG